MKLIYTLLLGLLFSSAPFAQKNVYLNIDHYLGEQPFALNEAYENDLGHRFVATRCEYYLSKFTLIHDGGQQTEVPVENTYLLTDATKTVHHYLGSFALEKLEGISFSVGVNAPTNNEDPAQWPSFHPLAPKSPSMHWGWSSGYRFVCLEGRAGSGLSTVFQMHGLWNRNYFEQTIATTGSIDPTDGSLQINLKADYKEALNGIDLNSGPVAHGIDRADLTVLENFRDYVFSAAGGSVSNTERGLLAVSLFPNPTQGDIQLNCQGIVYDQIVIKTLNGQEWKSFPNMGPDPKLNLNAASPGVYLLQLQNRGQRVGQQKIILQ
jgi:hypothetical protein